MWDHISSIEKDLQALLSEFGLADATAPTYKLPAYFVGGLYMPSLADLDQDHALRPDGLHFDNSGSLIVASRWLGPALVAEAVRPPAG